MGVFRYHGALPPDSPMFVGREAELVRIARLCRGDVESYVIVLGARQSGRTSLLYRLRAYVGNRAQVVPVNLQGSPDASPADVFYCIAQELTAELHREDHSTDHVRSAPTLKQLLCDLSPRRTIIVTIDEIRTAQRQAASDLLDALRAFHQDRFQPRYNVLRRYIFVLAGGIELYNLATGNVSPLHNVAEKFRLDDLSRAESDALLNRGFAKLGIKHSATHRLCDRIYHYARGHPYLTQRLGGFVEETLEVQKRTPTSGEFEETASDLASSGDPNVISLINDLRSEGLWAEARQLARGTSLPFSRIASVPCRLELLGLIRDTDGQCEVRNPIYKEVLRREENKTASVLWLEDIRPGTEDAKAYEQCVFQILRHCFATQLSYDARESPTRHGTKRRDITFFNDSSHQFWLMILQRHNATHIVFECKNTGVLRPSDVNQLAAYLGRSLGQFGVIVSRLPPGKNIEFHASHAFTENDKVVLFLSDRDLVEMARLDDQGEDPTEVIKQKYAEFMLAVQ